MDANFRLTCRNRKLRDIELSPGGAYFVTSQPYMQALSRFDDQKEVRARLPYACVDNDLIVA